MSPIEFAECYIALIFTIQSQITLPKFLKLADVADRDQNFIHHTIFNNGIPLEGQFAIVARTCLVEQKVAVDVPGERILTNQGFQGCGEKRAAVFVDDQIIADEFIKTLDFKLLMWKVTGHRVRICGAQMEFTIDGPDPLRHVPHDVTDRDHWFGAERS